MRPLLLVLVLVALLTACDDDTVGDVAEERADQARDAALDAGLGEDVADFLALLARGDTATYTVTYPGPTEDSELVVTNRPPDRRVDLVAGGELVEARLVVDGQAYECRPGSGCERTDAFVPPPGVFTEAAVDDLRAALVERSRDFDFAVETLPVAGVEARCLVTRVRAGRERPELGDSGTVCVAPSGAVVLVDQGEERLEALDYSAEIQPGAFDLGQLDEPAAAGGS